jgi:glyoxylase-like metal-dependent hydrolase (beta-lactamase superfamily II)
MLPAAEGEQPMGRVLRIAGITVAVLLVVGFGAWSWLTAREAVPEQSAYAIDLAELRALAASEPGPGPREIQSILVAEADMPRGMVFAGEPFEPLHQVHQVFRLVWADRLVLVDAAFPREQFEQMPAFGESTYHDAGWQMVERALATADQILITHEHFDHIAGVTALPEGRAAHLRLNAAQLANTAALDQGAIPEALREALEPLPAQRAIAVAPGVVLLAAPGHTPGSQIVYVRRADGREVLLLGDVAWNGDQIAELHYRPRLVTIMLGENRANVMAQLRTLHELAKTNPAVVQLVSHDKRQRAALLENGLLVEIRAE